MNKKIVMSVSVIVASAAVIIGGTSAFFSDTETSTGNTFTAGVIDLKVDSQQHYNNAICNTQGVWELETPGAGPTNPQHPVLGSPCGGTWGQNEPGVDITSEKFFSFGDIKPGDEGENTISLHVINNDAYVCATVAGLASNDVSQTEPESTAPLDTDDMVSGELDDTMVWNVWRDTNGDNIQNNGEVTLTSGHPVNGTLALYDSTTGAPLTGGTTGYLGVAWSLPLSTGNEVQTDSLTGDISFNVVQSRNNGLFKCSDGVPVTVHSDDLAVSFNEIGIAPNSWFFYNDTNDTVMTLNQFSGTGGVNDIVAFAGSNGAAKMMLDNGTQSPDYDGSGDLGNPRYNIATYKYKNVKLSDIDSLKYRMYDASASAETPYLNFNVDFDNSDAWQRRLVQVPTGVVANTWTTVDTLAGMWHLSGGNWPVGVNTGAPFAGSTDRTWASIIADYPNAETRSTDSWLGVRVGHPGPIGETNFVDWIEFDGETTDFEN